jgi:FKBP-type peptidyl-prolyl cis-trans isomerase FklB
MLEIVMILRVICAAMNKTFSRLLQACSLITLSSAALWANAQTPTATPAASPPPPAAPMNLPAPVPPAPVPTTEEGSYMIGVNFGQSLHQFGITNEVSIDTIIRGLKDGMGGKRLEPADQRSLQTFIHSLTDGIAQRNLKAGKDFLDKNGHQKGVTSTASGLQYKMLSPGDKKAASPTATDQVTVQYRGTLLDGTEFDSSYARNAPATFPVNGIIKGWQEALVMMKPGAKWQLWIPADLAYGDKPRPGIPAGSMLTFDVELVSIRPPPSAPAKPPVPGFPPAAGSPPAPPVPAAPPAPPAPPTPPKP